MHILYHYSDTEPPSQENFSNRTSKNFILSSSLHYLFRNYALEYINIDLPDLPGSDRHYTYIPRKECILIAKAAQTHGCDKFQKIMEDMATEAADTRIYDFFVNGIFQFAAPSWDMIQVFLHSQGIRISGADDEDDRKAFFLTRNELHYRYG